MVHLADEDRWADVSNTRVLLEHPGAALARATLLQYRPVNTDVLPTFVLFHLLFAPLLWLLLKAPHVAIAASALLYGLVQLYGWNLPGWPVNEWYFNPFAWQFLVVLGAWWVAAGRKRFRPLLTSRPFVGAAVIYLLFALVIALSWSFPPLQTVVPAFVAKAIYPIDKSDLDPLRLIHFLAITVLVARFVPSDWPGLISPVLRGAIRCGENSLEIFCLGVMLSLAAHMLLAHFSGGVAAQIGVSAAGVVILVAFATILTWIGIANRRSPGLM
jgi:hypothetical protein